MGVTPQRLDEILTVLAKHKVQQARVSETEVAVVFDVMPLPAVGDAPQPGGWKSPVNLDDPAQLELPREVP